MPVVELERASGGLSVDARLRGGVVGRGVEIDGEFGEIFCGDKFGADVEECAGAFFSGERGERGKMFAEEKRGSGVAAMVVSGDDAAAGFALAGDQARDHFGRKRGLVAERDESAVE